MKHIKCERSNQVSNSMLIDLFYRSVKFAVLCKMQ